MSMHDVYNSDPAWGDGMPLHGIYVGVVMMNNDPEGLGRVKVRIPRFSDVEPTNWARVVTFMGGMNRGAVFIPEVEDEVLVMFENGDIMNPYVIGALHNGQDVAPYANQDGGNNLRTIKSRSGHQITMDDTPGAERIELVDKTMTNRIMIDAATNAITITSTGNMDLNAPSGKITLTGTDITLMASGKIEMTSGADYSVKASGNVDVKGTQINLN